MPTVKMPSGKKKKFPYTEEGLADAKAAAKPKKKRKTKTKTRRA